MKWTRQRQEGERRIYPSRAYGHLLGDRKAKKQEGIGHTRKYCTGKAEICAHCGGEHRSQVCEKRQKGEAPKCINCTRDRLDDTAHGAFSSECRVRNKWDAIARARVSYEPLGNAAPTRMTDEQSSLVSSTPVFLVRDPVISTRSECTYNCIRPKRLQSQV
ncbi:hypothetical protein EVAR_59546_1 [Eumeta japonica]|uniref:Nucleic-acid-binding protein from transposon X-element n=1 Tax=Eumeta variegata TaxID=151549 RepID=A0A4C1ZXG4_EUMVA|nr:hypothetical protein EVAR_59546_1 [Eumeta japonica]